MLLEHYLYVQISKNVLNTYGMALKVVALNASLNDFKECISNVQYAAINTKVECLKSAKKKTNS